MNVYDFDGTIYTGDSTIDFYLHCLKNYPIIILKLPMQVSGFLKYKMGLITKNKFKEQFFCFLKIVPEIETEVDAFWDRNRRKIKEWYLLQQQETDIIISASPSFILKNICDRLQIKYLLASEFDPKTGKLSGENCYGEEKVRRFRQQFGNKEPKCFYSDSLSDQPMANISKKAFLVKGESRETWVK